MRNPFFDVLKFFAIMLVVYGHVAGGFGCDFGRPWIANFIVGMNMPVFFVVSGYFAAKTIESGDWRKLGKHILGYFWPMAAVSVVFAALAVIFHITGSEKGFVGYAGRWFLFAPWFLWCLAICFAVTFLCSRPKSAALKGGVFLLLIIILPSLRGVWYVDNVRAMLPYFLFGVVTLRKWEVWRDWRVGFPCLLMYLTGVIFQGDIHSNGLSFYGADTTWMSFVSNWKAFPLYLVRVANGIVGSVGVMWALQMLCDRFKPIVKLAAFGTTTLWVYVLHQWMLARVSDVGWGSPSIGCTLVWTGLLFAFCHFCGRGIQMVLNRKGTVVPSVVQEDVDGLMRGGR